MGLKFRWVPPAKPARRLSAHVLSTHDNVGESVPVLVPSEMRVKNLCVLSEIGSSLYVLVRKVLVCMRM